MTKTVELVDYPVKHRERFLYQDKLSVEQTNLAGEPAEQTSSFMEHLPLWKLFSYTLCLSLSLYCALALYLTKPLNKQFMFFPLVCIRFGCHEVFTKRSSLFFPSFCCNLQHRKDFVNVQFSGRE